MRRGGGDGGVPDALSGLRLPRTSSGHANPAGLRRRFDHTGAALWFEHREAMTPASLEAFLLRIPDHLPDRCRRTRRAVAAIHHHGPIPTAGYPESSRNRPGGTPTSERFRPDRRSSRRCYADPPHRRTPPPTSGGMRPPHRMPRSTKLVMSLARWGAALGNTTTTGFTVAARGRTCSKKLSHTMSSGPVHWIACLCCVSPFPLQHLDKINVSLKNWHEVRAIHQDQWRLSSRVFCDSPVGKA